ncbi:MAG: IS200/IS605 family transposase [Ignavibacteriae bacterium]|nr:IS200/IS605 family transposase [Ignavibacteriota bacterium]
MANTYTQIYLHLVFAVYKRENLIPHAAKTRLFRYITGIIQHPKRNHKLHAINGMPDHIHILLGLHPAQGVSDLVRDIKSNSTLFINKEGLVPRRFAWQVGYGAFSYGRSQLSQVIEYICRQEEHHRKRTFREEYEELLNRFDVGYNSEYLFEWIEDI